MANRNSNLHEKVWQVIDNLVEREIKSLPRPADVEVSPKLHAAIRVYDVEEEESGTGNKDIPDSSPLGSAWHRTDGGNKHPEHFTAARLMEFGP